MAEIPKPFPEEIREQFRSGIKETVAKNPDRLKEAVTARVLSGILGPLVDFDRLSTYYSTEQIAFLNEYAHEAARLAVQREQEIVAANPLFQLDIALAEVGGKEIEFCREKLRKSQNDIRSKAEKVTSTQEVGEISTDDIADQILKQDGTDDYSSRQFASGRIGDINPVLIVLGGSELEKRIKTERDKLMEQSPRKGIFIQPTVFEGISIKVNLDGEHGYFWLSLDLVLDRETVKKVIEGPDLPPLPKE